MSDFDSSGKGGKRGSKGGSVWDHLRTIGQGVLDGFTGGGKPAATSGKGVQRSVSRQDPLTSERRVAASQVKRSLRAWRDRQDAEGGATGATGVQRKPQIPSGGGAPLPGAVKSKMEGKLGADLSNVKIHTGGDSEKASEDLNAKAFTVGNDVHFGSGQFDPSSKEGEKLIAHELTHVVQGQRGGDGGGGGGAQRAEENEADSESEAVEGADGEALEVSSPDEPAEKEADEVSEKVVEGEETQESQGATSPKQLNRQAVYRTSGDTAATQGKTRTDLDKELADIFTDLTTKACVKDLATYRPHIQGKYNKAADDRQRQQVIAEARRVQTVAGMGATAVYGCAKAGQEYDLAGKKVSIDPLSEADVLYIMGDTIHIDEVAHVAHGLRMKAMRSTLADPGQFDRLIQWRTNNPGAVVEFAVDDETAWTEIFGMGEGESASAAQRIFGNQITITIGSTRLDPPTFSSLFDKIKAKFSVCKSKGYVKNWSEYFAKYNATVADGIALAAMDNNAIPRK